jgi:hypothetical protein
MDDPSVDFLQGPWRQVSETHPHDRRLAGARGRLDAHDDAGDGKWARTTEVESQLDRLARGRRALARERAAAGAEVP